LCEVCSDQERLAAISSRMVGEGMIKEKDGRYSID
jgi:hypothetical protein